MYTLGTWTNIANIINMIIGVYNSTIIFNQPTWWCWIAISEPTAATVTALQKVMAEPPTERSRQWKATKLTSIHGRPKKKDTTTPQDSGGTFSAPSPQPPVPEMGRCDQQWWGSACCKRAFERSLLGGVSTILVIYVYNIYIYFHTEKCIYILYYICILNAHL